MSSSSPLNFVLLGAFLVLTLAACDSGDSGWVPSPVEVFDLDGRKVQAPGLKTDVAQVFLFSRVDCPISNRYAAEVNRIYEEFTSKGVEFTLVFVDPEETAEIIRNHVQEFSYKIKCLRDPERRLAVLAGATVTPEVVVYSGKNGMVYRGRIDDMWVDFGKQRNEPDQRDLRQVLTDLVAGKELSFRSTKAIGCYIEEVK